MEIMVVVAIISLLAAIAIPTLLRAGARSQATTCINNLRQLDTAVQQFSIEAGKHVAGGGRAQSISLHRPHRLAREAPTPVLA